MGLLDKIPFLGKKQEANFDLPPMNQPAGFPGNSNDPFGPPPGWNDPNAQINPQPFSSQIGQGFTAPESFQSQQQFSAPQQSLARHDMELLIAKIDTLKATLDNLNQRISNLEQALISQRRRF